MRVFSSLLAVAAFALGVAAAAKTKAPKGFAYVDDGEFKVDGDSLNFVGANSYWLPLLQTQKDVDTTFKEMQKAGIKVLRTWGFNMINATELPYVKANDLTYYQLWNGSDWTLNEGPNGLQRLDRVIETAGKYGIKVILTFTNNWIGYGGVEIYLNWIVGANATHDQFYTDKRVNASYQRYVKTLVNRYKNSPNIFAWELINEARCSGDLGSSPACSAKTGLIHDWYKTQSAFVKKLDPHHLLSTGGEGQMYITDPSRLCLSQLCVYDYSFNGGAGEDFEADLALPDVDFGVYHMYPQYWESGLDNPESNVTLTQWGAFWINEHAKVAKKLNKPLVLEEFGYAGYDNKTSAYPIWVGTALATEHAGVMPWQWGQLGLKDTLFKYADFVYKGASPNDGFAIYKNETEVWNIFTTAAKVQKFRSLLN